MKTKTKTTKPERPFRYFPDDIEYIAHRFGGGDYRAKILGEWDRERRCEQYFERVSFAIDDFYKPTAETLARTRSALQK